MPVHVQSLEIAGEFYSEVLYSGVRVGSSVERTVKGQSGCERRIVGIRRKLMLK